MDHPLLAEEHSDVRRRVVRLLSSGYNVRNSGNIIFVCGGNKPRQMRNKFKRYCKKNLPEFEIFFPEYAMENYFSDHVSEPFDIADFESLIGKLSHAIVIFPEAPGSFAETGYFSAVPHLAKKALLVMDLNRQGQDSFIMMGPAKKIGEQSVFQPVMQLNYKKPAFDDMAKRLTRVRLNKNRKSLDCSKFDELTEYDIFCLIYQCAKILSICRISDILFMLRALSKAQVSPILTKKLTSILVGAEYFLPIGQYGHYAPNHEKNPLLGQRTGTPTEEDSLMLDLAIIYAASDPEFLELVEESRNVN